jgi:hypothetical protein
VSLSFGLVENNQKSKGKKKKKKKKMNVEELNDDFVKRCSRIANIRSFKVKSSNGTREYYIYAAKLAGQPKLVCASKPESAADMHSAEQAVRAVRDSLALEDKEWRWVHTKSSTSEGAVQGSPLWIRPNYSMFFRELNEAGLLPWHWFDGFGASDDTSSSSSIDWSQFSTRSERPRHIAVDMSREHRYLLEPLPKYSESDIERFERTHPDGAALARTRAAGPFLLKCTGAAAVAGTLIGGLFIKRHPLIIGCSAVVGALTGFSTGADYCYYQNPNFYADSHRSTHSFFTWWFDQSKFDSTRIQE